MSEESIPPVSTPPAEETATEEVVLEALEAVPADKAAKKKPSPKFIAATDLASVVEILVKCDNISPEEAVRRLNVMCERGSLLIVPPFGARKR